MTGSSSSDPSSRPAEAHPRLLREGEVSPFKILVAILLRENYKHPEVKSHLPGNRISLAEFFYKLISTEDLSYTNLRSQLKDPLNCLPVEIKMSFLRITENLDDENPGFLYELVPSIIDQFDATQIQILGKRVTKSSPLGKFLRLLLLSIRKMSYPQVFHLYKQLCIYIKKDFDPKMSTLQKPGAITVSKAFSKLYLQQHPPLFKGAEKVQLDAFTQMVQNRLSEGKEGIDLSVYSSFNNELLIAKNELTLEQIDEIKSIKSDKLKKYKNAVEKSSKNLRQNWKKNENVHCDKLVVNVVPPSSANPKLNAQNRKIKGKAKSPRKDKNKNLDDLIVVRDSEDGYLPSEEEAEPMDTSSSTTTLISQRTRSQCSSIKKNRTSSEQNVLSVMDKLTLNSPAPAAVPGLNSNEEPCGLIAPSKRWDDIKWHSRKLIDRTVKSITSNMLYIGNRRYSPKDVSYFVESIRHNPSAQSLLPQLFFLEYINCLQLKDVTRCTESLRTSFDLRVKPMTAEVGKGTPYAAYVFAMFYKYLGYDQDSMSYLEEAFQAAHSAWDRVCLEYCHNLWASFHNTVYEEGISTTPKSVDKNLAYLHTYNAIARSFSLHNQGALASEAMQLLWCSNTDHEFEVVESLLLMALINRFSILGWNYQSELLCLLFLKSSSSIRWPVRYYISAICMYSNLLLLKGKVEQAELISNYGNVLYGGESSMAGEILSMQQANYHAMKSFLAYEPVGEEVIKTILAFNRNEAYYWSAYSKMILNDWDEAGQMIRILFDNLEAESCENSDLKIRAHLLNAEINCLHGNPTSALQHLFDGLKLAEQLNAEFYISLYHINIALIQNHLNLPSTAGKTLNQNTRTVLRSCTPFLQARLYLANIRVSINNTNNINTEQSKPPAMNLFEIYNLFTCPNGEKKCKRPKLSCKADYILKSGKEKLLDRINKVEKIYKNWNNQYRLKETIYIKSMIYEFVGDTENMVKSRGELNEIKSFCPWSESTCII